MTSDIHADLEVMPSIHPYQDWQQQEGLPRISGFYVDDLVAVEVAPWASRAASGAFVNLEGTGGVNDLQILEVRAGGSTVPVHPLFEALTYVVAGRGSAAVWYAQAERSTFEFGAGSVFSIPLNATYRFFNGSGSQPLRIIVVTNAPLIMNLFHNSEFIFGNPFVSATASVANPAISPARASCIGGTATTSGRRTSCLTCARSSCITGRRAAPVGGTC